MTDQPQETPQPAQSAEPVVPVQPQAQYTPPTYAAPAPAQGQPDACQPQAAPQQTYQQPQAAPQPVYVQQPYSAPVYTTAGTVYAMTDTDRTLRLIAFILNLITTVACAILILPLAWAIPMTVHSWGIYKGTKANTVAFGVCTLIFLNFISGILLLVSNKEA